MPPRVIVLGSGYAGVGTIRALEAELDPGEADLVWTSDVPHHFLLHEAHRLIRDPSVRESFAIPVDEVASPRTDFVEARVEEIHEGNRAVELSDGSDVEYDYVVDCLGSKTAFYGIDGMARHALTLKGANDALEINEAVEAAARGASRGDPARVVVGGAGLSGIQSAGEIAALRDERGAPIEVHLVEALDRIFPGGSHEFQGALRDRLEAHDVAISTGAAIESVDDSTLEVDGGEPIDYDVLLWTGGVTGVEEIGGPDVETEDDRVEVDRTLRSGDERVYVAGDAAVVDAGDGEGPPPTAQAAWDEAEVAGENVARAIRGEPLRRWRYVEKGTLVSVGDDVVGHDVVHVPVSTFGGSTAKLLKKAIGARWIGQISSWPRAARTWRYL